MFTTVITTCDVFSEDDVKNTLIDSDSMLGQPKPYQTVVAVGNAVHDVKVGDVVAIDFSKYARTKHKEGSLKDGVIQDNPVVSYEFNSIVIDNKEHLFLHTNDILFVIEDYEEVEEVELITTSKEVVS
jgi:co-chaperonin GroES (HSP10)